MASTFSAHDATAYDRLMGRWSRRLAIEFLSHAGCDADEHVLEMGCGTGSLTFAIPEHVATLTAVDFSPIYVAAAQAANVNPRITIEQGDGAALRFADGVFDRALSQLVLQFIPDPVAAIRELRRVVRSGGVVAACAWDSYGGMPGQRIVWENAAAIDPEGARQRAKWTMRPAAQPGGLARLFEAAGLWEVDETTLVVRQQHTEFADYWGPMAAGEGSLGAYIAAMTPDLRTRLEEMVRDSYLCGGPDGPRSFPMVAWSVRGVVPG